jgi:predicted nicotinamide N-methyase
MTAIAEETTYTYDFPPHSVGVCIRERTPVRHSLDSKDSKAFREKAADDVTGWTVWSSSVILSRYIVENAAAPMFRGAKILELGCGCGLAGITAAVVTGALTCTLSDFQDKTMENLRHNSTRNSDAEGMSGLGCSISTLRIDWDDESTWPVVEGLTGQFDVIIAADSTYKRSYARKLFPVVDSLLKAGGKFIYASPAAREGLPMLLKLVSSHSYAVENIIIPLDWHACPLRPDETAGCTDGLFPELSMGGYEFVLSVCSKC